MKFTTLEYNMNYPFMQQVTAPLNSTYGVAVKATKDGEQLALTSADVTIGDISAVGAHAGYVCFELSSGTAPSTGVYPINISCETAECTFSLAVQEKDMGYFEI